MKNNCDPDHFRTKKELVDYLLKQGWKQDGTYFKSPYNKRQYAMTLREACGIEMVWADTECFD